MKRYALLVSLLFASNLYANPCESWFYADSHGKGVIRVQVAHGKLDAQKVKAAVAGLSPAEWDTLAPKLQADLGPGYQVRVFTAAEFAQSGHDCAR